MTPTDPIEALCKVHLPAAEDAAARGDYGDAEQRYRAAREALTALGPNPLLGTCLLGQADLAYIQGRYEEAESLFLQAIAVLRTALLTAAQSA